MSTEDIERFKEKLDKDPNSKLFVPLAEEYKKAGMFDEAIDVLTKGLERQPTYLSARVSLGKIYSERGMLDEASAEFEKVIDVIPDNLYAHKKLAEIYKDLGRKDDAVKEFRTVLRLNPADEWAIKTLTSIEQAAAAPHEEEQEISREEKTISQAREAEIFPVEEPVETVAAETGLAASFDETLTARDLEISQNLAGEPAEEQAEEPPEISLGGEETETWITPPEEPAETGEQEVEVPFSGETADLWNIPADTKEEVKEEPVESPLGSDTDLWGAPEPIEEIEEGPQVPPKKSISKEDMELWKMHLETAEEEPAKPEEVLEPPVELAGEERVSFEEILPEKEPIHEIFAEEKPIPAQPSVALRIRDADAHINQGKYSEAMRVYRGILSENPDDKRVLQRVDELRTLLKLLGKDKEELIAKLDHFLEGIKKRRNEFSGSS